MSGWLYRVGVTQPAEHVERHQPTAPVEDDPWCQMNVRVRKSMLTRLDRRRKTLDLTRDDWIRHVIEWALFQPPGTPVRPIRDTNGRRRR
jgi:hypothetical protein